MSFVDNFNDKRITSDGLLRLLKVNYQKETLLELIIDNYDDKVVYEIGCGNHFYLILENNENLIFLVLSTEHRTVNKINNTIKQNINKKIYVITFKELKNIERINNEYKVVSQLDWMNKIISHGIDLQILALQNIRDMDFYYD